MYVDKQSSRIDGFNLKNILSLFLGLQNLNSRRSVRKYFHLGNTYITLVPT